MLPSEAILTGTQINYYIVCPTKLWLFSHNITMEHTSELVSMGKFLHSTTYPRMEKDAIIDDKIGIDFIRRGDGLTLHEIKKSKKIENAHKYQLLYYIYYLKVVKCIMDVDGMIDYPLLRKREKLILTDDLRKEIENMIVEAKRITLSPTPPEPKKKKYCRKCAYFEFCWV